MNSLQFVLSKKNFMNTLTPRSHILTAKAEPKRAMQMSKMLKNFIFNSGMGGCKSNSKNKLIGF